MRAAVLTAAGALAAALLLWSAPQALAHTALDTADPAPGATVERLDRIRLEFATRVAPDAPRMVTLSAPDGSRGDDGTVGVDGAGALTVGVARLPVAGQYTVRWCMVSDDGHEQRGAYAFSYRGPVAPGAPGRAGPAEVSCAPASAAAAGPQGDGAGAEGPPVGWFVGGGVALAAAGALVAGRRRGR